VTVPAEVEFGWDAGGFEVACRGTGAVRRIFGNQYMRIGGMAAITVHECCDRRFDDVAAGRLANDAVGSGRSLRAIKPISSAGSGSAFLGWVTAPGSRGRSMLLNVGEGPDVDVATFSPTATQRRALDRVRGGHN
jgi:hypothetical protein